MNKISKRGQTREETIFSYLENVRIIMDKEEARDFLEELGDKVVALDFETTGLDPMYAKVRLSCIFHPDHGVVLLDHFFCGTFGELSGKMLGPMWAVYNAKFEVRWFDHFQPNQVDLIDVDFLAKSHLGGYPSSLAVMCKRDLGIILDKEEQLSDWTKDRLSPSQIEYAAKDAIVTYMLYEYWADKLPKKKLDAAFIFQDAVRATVECEQTGMVLDVPYHEKNISKWTMKQSLMLKRVRNWTNENLLPNPGSDKQVSDLIKKQISGPLLNMWPKTAKTEQLTLNRKVIQPIVAKAPYPFSRWMNALIRFRYYRKYLNTYGGTLVTKQHLEGGISYRLNIAQAATGRYSSSSINIQNIPRAPWVRKAFKPPAGFDYFVVADYSGIEVRILAELANDETLRNDAIYGDVHAGSASAIYNIDLEDFLAVINEPDTDENGEYVQHSQQYYHFKEMRSRAKNFTFQNVYGAGALALSITLKCSVEEAEDALRKWAQRYQKAYNYRHIIYDQMMQGGYLPVCDGRTVFVWKQDRTLPVAANYGVQGAAASVMYRAMHHVYERREAETNRHLIRMCATVHDELLLAVADEEYIPLAKDILVGGMIQGYLDVFPGANTDNLVEAKAGKTWGDAK